MRNLIWLFVVLLVGTTALAQKPRPRKHKPMANQGICGTVLEKKGNHMPGPDKPMPKGQPVVREVVVYPVLTMEQVKATDEGFIIDVPGIKPVKTVKSDKQGKFCVYHLPPGTYSVMTREPKGLYGNLFDIDGRINPLIVKAGKVTNTTLEITYQAAF
ncbi:MAG: prealbumin-like fold domain-containing protein [Rudanella sp.]|nr:prealbumin-like fold domain-containing protein [Rudanella sp.]